MSEGRVGDGSYKAQRSGRPIDRDILLKFEPDQRTWIFGKIIAGETVKYVT